MHKSNKLICFLAVLTFLSLTATAQRSLSVKDFTTVSIGAQRFDLYLPKLKGKRVGIVTNITGVIGTTSIVDTLLKLNVKVKKIFGPEHGFRSNSDAGEVVKSNKDAKTGLPVISLYGSNKKPTKEQLKDLDVIIYDIQDVGVRFYTYISTMCYVMEACAENKKEMIVMDRPNPNGFYLDGPVLKPELTSFLGLHPVPIVYAMTCGEYAQMANGEGWLKNGVKCKLTVIPLKNYDRKSSYRLPVKPSPNLPNEKAVLLYPSLGLFEGTIMSVGRGTDFPFQVLGHPQFPDTTFGFTPVSTAITKDPKYKDQKCYGLDLRKDNYIIRHPHRMNLEWILSIHTLMNRPDFFDKNFDYHAGTKELKQQIAQGLNGEDIRLKWDEEIVKFKPIRKKYLLYEDYE